MSNIKYIKSKMTDECGVNYLYDNVYDSDDETDTEGDSRKRTPLLWMKMRKRISDIIFYVIAILYYVYYFCRNKFYDFLNMVVPKTTNIKPIIISIEGNIGSGKSTLVKYLKKVNKDWIFLDEPVGEWEALKNEDDKSLLQCFYGDMSRWSYTFQNYAFITRMRKLIKACKKRYTKPTIIVTERSVYTDRHVFAEMLLKDGKMSQMEMDIYLNWFNLLLEFATIDHVVYLRTDSKKCLERIQKRAREGEDNITIDYLLSLEQQHDKWINNHQPSLLLDGNTDLNIDNTEHFIGFNRQIKNYLK